MRKPISNIATVQWTLQRRSHSHDHMGSDRGYTTYRFAVVISPLGDKMGKMLNGYLVCPMDSMDMENVLWTFAEVLDVEALNDRKNFSQKNFLTKWCKIHCLS